MMRETLRCPRCRALRIWRIDPVRERGWTGATWEVAVAVERPTRPRAVPPPARDADGVDLIGWLESRARPLRRKFGRYAIAVCGGCGLVEWYAQDFAPTATADVAAIRRACRACRATEAWHVLHHMSHDLAGRPRLLRIVRDGFPWFQARGSYETFVCRACGFTDWHGRRLHELRAPARRRPLPCVACQREDFFAGAAAGFSPGIGRFAVEICAGCGHADWRALGLARLRPDPAAGVTLMERLPPTETATRSPYR
jgi:hypothetical protein